MSEINQSIAHAAMVLVAFCFVLTAVSLAVAEWHLRKTEKEKVTTK